eukprot:SM000522S17637  [mRNA]  locus=s522:1192:4257:- [translate_table: standard]
MPPSAISAPRAASGAFLTIPPGLSPTTLLDSPVLLSYSQAEPSPTTGTFPLPPFFQGGGTRALASSDTLREMGQERGSTPGFVFKPFVRSMPARPDPSRLSPLASKPPPPLEQQPSPPPASRLELDNQGASTPMEERGAEDGYNWRKYGQKQVKGSEFPRSYYKCTHAGCSVKKKVERSLDGHVTERVYKGVHNHARPAQTRKAAASAQASLAREFAPRGLSAVTLNLSAAKVEGGSGICGALSDETSAANIVSLVTMPPWGGFQPVARGGAGAADVQDVSPGFATAGFRDRVVRAAAACDVTSQVAAVPLHDEVTTSAGTVPMLATAIHQRRNSDLSTSPLPSDEDEEAATPSNLTHDSKDERVRKRKRPKKDAASASVKPTREDRVVFQATSEVELLDDGFRWRKYGQKVVKGNPHPRSYYKCTSPDCPVRKHVERSPTDIKEVVTTYEGKHNHDVPISTSRHNTQAEEGRRADVAAARLAGQAGSSGGVHAVSMVSPTSPSLHESAFGPVAFYGKLLKDALQDGEEHRSRQAEYAASLAEATVLTVTAPPEHVAREVGRQRLDQAVVHALEPVDSRRLTMSAFRDLAPNLSFQ